MQIYANNMKKYKYANNTKYINCISQICKKCAVKICRSVQFYIQNMQKSICCICCIYMHSPHFAADVSGRRDTECAASVAIMMQT